MSNTPPTSRGEQARNQLIHSALNQFGEYGLHATTRDIAAGAGQNIAAITYYFGSKDDLYLACARWIAGFIQQNLAVFLPQARQLLAASEPDRPAIRALIHQWANQMLHLLTARETINISRFISREQLSPTSAYRLIHDQVIDPLHITFTAMLARYTGRQADDVETILHAQAMVGEILTFRLLQETVLLRTGWKTFDEEKTRVICRVVNQHFDLILQGLSAQQGIVSHE
ncbi:transcriptional regulator CecR [Shimwellia blattae]|uniref:Putative HTH-type transcriptional regulator n=1 Tax=Shimwellia blattae (strain ATCC 29907 / DSM 4481 / JCM 1650 / NBRC 105725 / CDC 9005-74) TaxID=630626 RepID=I2BAY7_SHIBC|nr:transcriptional regulator CecR [Shimwellia blattae]AFJ47691.1 putative HTH-type transcriptional regulator [Shimwellia blattae DSM 4481 = NBRC 105725]GAB79729.1 putative TetR family transcriptional regulator YbiH [Shimwellia blattae DSM 4481 = NBRC 105725]VDY65191.1 putative DNA-binding transcriptional regulator [Shimwellia blattae]VEC23850.1 putative DNA-binding transcriptional regulator [Shimwellia blattae]